MSAVLIVLIANFLVYSADCSCELYFVFKLQELDFEHFERDLGQISYALWAPSNSIKLLE